MAPVWSCQSCFHVFHLNCIKKWARSPASQADGTLIDSHLCIAAIRRVPLRTAYVHWQDQPEICLRLFECKKQHLWNRLCQILFIWNMWFLVRNFWDFSISPIIVDRSWSCMPEIAAWSYYKYVHQVTWKLKFLNWNGSIFTDGTEGWRCPACQHVALKAPNAYTCFCGKIILCSALHMMFCMNLSKFVTWEFHLNGQGRLPILSFSALRSLIAVEICAEKRGVERNAITPVTCKSPAAQNHVNLINRLVGCFWM